MTAGWGICRGHYLMLWVNGETAANSGARNPLPPPGMGSVPVTQMLVAPRTSPRHPLRRAAGCSGSQTMGEVQKVRGIRLHPACPRAAALAPAPGWQSRARARPPAHGELARFPGDRDSPPRGGGQAGWICGVATLSLGTSGPSPETRLGCGHGVHGQQSTQILPLKRGCSAATRHPAGLPQPPAPPGAALRHPEAAGLPGAGAPHRPAGAGQRGQDHAAETPGVRGGHHHHPHPGRGCCGPREAGGRQVLPRVMPGFGSLRRGSTSRASTRTASS